MKILKESEFIEKLRSSEFGIEYLDTISKVASENRGTKKEVGFELHHVHPRKLGGALIKENLVKVTSFEHCYLHALLAKAIPCYETLQPIVMLSDRVVKKLSDLDKITLEKLYQWSILRDKALHQPKSEAWHRATVKANIGRVISEETRLKMSLSHKGQSHSSTNKGMVWVVRDDIDKMVYPSELDTYLANGYMRGRSSKGKPSNRVNYKHSAATREKMSQTRKGKKRSKESVEKQICTRRERGQLAMSVETRVKIGQASRGKVAITDGTTVRMVRPEELSTYLQSGWVKGRKIR